ncbi:hypothetical protein NUW54_g5098 [Trametes sanguinea]|uniref:Uncharacterized protein n=1 Tax=Trametes sanguinea TaxID=158606 RepID=A0ACC1PYL7_9APHY|nr:hypothetical protein NUW54_g5098 [Trametes sanguinea]
MPNLAHTHLRHTLARDAIRRPSRVLGPLQTVLARGVCTDLNRAPPSARLSCPGGARVLPQLSRAPPPKITTTPSAIATGPELELDPGWTGSFLRTVLSLVALLLRH